MICRGRAVDDYLSGAILLKSADFESRLSNRKAVAGLFWTSRSKTRDGFKAGQLIDTMILDGTNPKSSISKCGFEIQRQLEV
jgi:hypothetical protein